MKSIKYLVIFWALLALTLLATSCSTEQPTEPPCAQAAYTWVIEESALLGFPGNFEAHIWAYKHCSNEPGHFMTTHYDTLWWFIENPDRFEPGDRINIGNDSNWIRID